MTKNKYSQLPVILIDQISMVSNKLVMNAYRGPLEKFSCYPGVITDISVIACGFFYQLSPNEQRPVYDEFDNGMLNISNFWELFKIPEVTEVMRQRVDQTLVTLLNNIRTGNYRKPGKYFTIKIYKKIRPYLL